MKHLSIIIPTWGRSLSTIERLLTSIQALETTERAIITDIVLADQNDPSLELECMVNNKYAHDFLYQVSQSFECPSCANAETSSAGDTGVCKDTRIKLLHLTGLRPSVTEAKNRAIAASDGDLLLLLDDDVEILPGSLAAHVAYQAQDAMLGCLGGRETVLPADLNRSPWIRFMTRLIARRRARRVGEAAWRWQGQYVGRLTPGGFFLASFDEDVQGLVRADFVRGCHWSLPRAAYDAAGGFDTGYTGTALREETDLQLRVLAAGYQTAFTGDARVLHYRGSGGCQNLSKKLFVVRSKLECETRFQLKFFRTVWLPLFAIRLLPLLFSSLIPSRGLSLFVWLWGITRFWWLKHASAARTRWLANP